MGVASHREFGKTGMWNACLTQFMASDVIPVICKTWCKYVYARHSRYGMLIKGTACFSNNKNVLREGISLRHSILNKEMLFVRRLLLTS